MTKSITRVHQALIELLAEKNYEDIQVKDIVDCANIARATFYLHFSSKEEVFVDYIDAMFDMFFAEVEDSFTSTETIDETVAKKMFEVFQSESKFSLVLMQENLQPLLLKRFRGYLSRVVGHVVRTNQHFLVEQDQVVFLVDYWAAGTLQLLSRWVSNQFQPSMDDMARLYSKLTISGMKALLPDPSFVDAS